MKTQIVATIGPATFERKVLAKIIPKITAARLNFSWGSYDEHASFIERIREEAAAAQKKILIIADLSGPRVQEKTGHEFDTNAHGDITEKDLSDLQFALAQNVDRVAMSYVGSAKDIEALRAYMQATGKIVPIIAKIERKIALTDLPAIIAAADEIMVARGDLGNEIPLEKIPFVEKDIIESCIRAGKPVIVATQMLLSMTQNPTPTRAEVTDVTFAVLTGADAVMLSEESASGKYPIEAVEEMDRIITEASEHLERNTILAL